MEPRVASVEAFRRTALRSSRRRGPAIAVLALALALAGCGSDVTRPRVLLLSGVVYEELTIGDGRSVRRNDRVSIDYMMRVDGDPASGPVDSSSAFLFTVGTGEVIPGLEQGMVGMRERGRRRITIPPRLAYGAEGYHSIIPPNATLLFDVSLRGIVNR